MILVIGSTGTVGSEVVRQALAAGVGVRALVRSPEKGAEAETAGAQIAIGDTADSESLDAAFEGIDHLFLVLPSVPNQIELESSVVAAAKRRGDVHVVKLSVLGADPDSPVRFVASHAQVERVLAESGLGHTLLRPTDFMQNMFGWAATLRTGRVYSPVPDAPISSVDVRDIAAVAVAALTEPGHEGKIYELTGSEALTRSEQAAKLAAAVGVDVETIAVSNDQAREALLGAGVAPYAADGLVELNVHVYEPGHAGALADGVREATGKAPRTFDNFVREHAGAF